MTMFSDSMMLGGAKGLGFSNLAALFAGGADGLMIDLTNKDTLFQDANGALPVSANNDPVGLALDQHKWGGLTLAAYRAAQAEKVTNAEFTTDVAGWSVLGGGASISWVAGKLRLNNPSAATPYFYSSFSTVVGRWYELSVAFDIQVGTGSPSLFIGTASGSGANYSGSNIITTPGTYRRWFKATAATTFVTIQCASGTSSSDWDSVSVKEIDGHHAVQNPTSVRPTWASATSDVAFDGSNDYLTTSDFYFKDSGNFMAAYFAGVAGSNYRGMLGASASPGGMEYAQLGVANSTNRMYASMGPNTREGTTSIQGATGTLLADQGSLEQLFRDGIQEGSYGYGGPMPDAATGRMVYIGCYNSFGTASGFYNGRLKRVICGQVRVQDTMSALEFHQNLIAP
jgi:hypothetical protein